jgi:hypothetical protein
LNELNERDECALAPAMDGSAGAHVPCRTCARSARCSLDAERENVGIAGAGMLFCF